MAGRFFMLVAYIGWIVLAIVVITALLALFGYNRFEQIYPNSPM
ncbi:MAG TPA: hypothetical protein VFL82_00310 [Thermomicrobiales bacterium]|jgi:hypothetical protein|nr:hypothetical protein [Thermomicrobiales bacterium]